MNRGASYTKLATAGAIAGLGGGLVFGILMGMMGMLPIMGMLIRVENAVVGFIVHWKNIIQPGMPAG